MKVSTVSASVRFSKAIGDSQHKTIELSAEATLDARETWTEAQASLYRQLGQQIKALWNDNQASSDGNGQTPAHYCQDHQTEYRRFEKDGRVWYSHKAPDGKWCQEK